MGSIGSRRGSGSGSAVLDAPEEMYAPAPAGALRRGFTEDDEEDRPRERVQEPRFVSRRETFQVRVPGIPRGLWGRILWGSGAFGLLVVGVAGAVGLRHYLLHDERFVVTTSADIQMTGNKHLTREQMLTVFGADLERNIFRMPLAERRADLERLPWVAHATVMRLLPNQVRVAITERVPVAFVRNGTQIGLVDANGVLLDLPVEAAGDPHYSFPVLTGLSESDPLSTRKARMEIYWRFMQDLDGGGGKVTESVSEVDVSDPEDVKAVVASDGADVLVHFGDEDFLTRYQEFEQHLPEWRQMYPKLVSADMRYQNEIVLDAGVPLAGGAPAGAAPTDATAAATSATTNAGDAGTTTAPAAKAEPPVQPKATVKPVARVVPAKRVAGGPKVSAANQRMYAALAAAHEADLKKAAVANGVRVGAVKP